MRKAEIYIHDILTGILTENEEGYHFCYDEIYLKKDNPESICLTLPVSTSEYHNNVLFPFFDGLIPEGWLLDIATKNWKLDPRDRMGLLLSTCFDCIGAVSIQPVEGVTNDD